MSKTKEKIEVVEDNKNGTLETEDKAKEAIDNLKVQLEEYLKQSEYFKTMAVKAQGALEVLLQLHPQESSGEGS